MGVAATQMERRRIRTELGDKNRAIAVTNQQLGMLAFALKETTDATLSHTAIVSHNSLVFKVYGFTLKT